VTLKRLVKESRTYETVAVRARPCAAADGGTIKFAADGTVKSFVRWNPANLSHLAAYELASGEIAGVQSQTLSAGKLGSFTAGEDSTIVLGLTPLHQRLQHRPVQRTGDFAPSSPVRRARPRRTRNVALASDKPSDNGFR
jgi:hypothetical protein